MNSQTSFLPLARTDALITKEADGELLIYDLDLDRAHCLNAAAYAIWRRCDGRSTVLEIANAFSESTGAPLSEDLIYLAIRQFKSVNLLADSAEPSRPFVYMSRRALMRNLGLGVALLPLITSITAPTALAAVSCAGPCNPSQPNKGCAAGCTCTAIGNKCVNV